MRYGSAREGLAVGHLHPSCTGGATGRARLPKATSTGSSSGNLSLGHLLTSFMRPSLAEASLFWAVITVPSNLCACHLVYTDCFSSGRRKHWSRKGEPFWKSKPFMTKSAIWSSMKNKGLFSGCWLLCHKGKTNKQKMSSLFSDVLSVINHRWLSKGNKTHAVMHCLFQWGLFSLSFLVLCFFFFCVEPQSIGYNHCCLRSATTRENMGLWEYEGKKEKEELSYVLLRLCSCYPFIGAEKCEHVTFLAL